MTCAGEEMAVCLFTGGIALQPCRVRGRRGGGRLNASRQVRRAWLEGCVPRGTLLSALPMRDQEQRIVNAHPVHIARCGFCPPTAHGHCRLQASSFRIALAPPHSRKKRNGVLKSTYAAHFLQFLLLTASLSHGPSCVLSSTRSRIFRFQELRGVQCVSSF